MAIKKRAHINLETLQTVAVEVEAILNDCPLTYLSNEIADPEPLTPAHLLHGKRLTRHPHECTTLGLYYHSYRKRMWAVDQA